jgi:hypothetical protein
MYQNVELTDLLIRSIYSFFMLYCEIVALCLSMACRIISMVQYGMLELELSLFISYITIKQHENYLNILKRH